MLFVSAGTSTLEKSSKKKKHKRSKSERASEGSLKLSQVRTVCFAGGGGGGLF